MTTHITTIEAAYTKAADTLGISPEWDKALTATMKRRDAAVALFDLKPRDAAAELAAAPNPRTWDSIITEVATHNARVAEAQAAIRGRLLTTAQAQLDAQLKAFLPQYAGQAYERVSGVLASITDTAAHVASLNAETAVRNGYGDALTQLHQLAMTVRTHTAIGATVAPAGKVAQAARALALITNPGRIDPIKKTPASRWNQGGETRSNPADLARRDEARRLMTDWHRDETDTLRKLARGEYAGFQLSAATSDDYAHRVTQFENADRIEVVAD
ncbi:hypothetical protein [Dietzia sp. MNB45]|uniref:hypothetical protein n=1 Tax=Dietzia sp. MNB45 TaxID=3238800 RepID=UPI003F81A851